MVEEHTTSSTENRHECPDSDDDDEYNDDGVWKFMEDDWELDQPKSIISIIDDNEPFFTNQRLLKSILCDLVNATATTGIRFRSVTNGNVVVYKLFSDIKQVAVGVHGLI